MRKLKQLRKEKAFTQIELSERSGLSQSFIHDLETGKKDPTLKTLHKLAIALGVPVSTLLEDEEERTA